MGQVDAANAWLQVMSGETIPGSPSVLRTRRNGHGSSHRVVVLVDPADPQPGDAPRALAEPALAALAAARLEGFGSAFVRVTVRGENGDPPTLRDLTLAGDLGMAPMSGFEQSPVAPLWMRLGVFLYEHGEPFYNFQGLRAYKDKFDPVWDARYLAYPGGLKLARILADISALVAGGYRRILFRA